MNDIMIIENDEPMYPEEWAALWGCDPRYDIHPRLPGDGNLFYNFGSEILDRNKDWLKGFLDAIDRTILKIKDNVSNHYELNDLENMNILRKYVENLIERPKDGNTIKQTKSI